MAPRQTTSATTTTVPDNTDSSAESGGTATKREAKPLTPVKAITRISDILEQLPLAERKRVLAFINDDVQNSGDASALPAQRETP